MWEGKREHDATFFGEVCATLANQQRDPKKRSMPWTARDVFPFLPRVKRKPMRLSPEQKAAIKARMNGGR